MTLMLAGVNRARTLLSAWAAPMFWIYLGLLITLTWPEIRKYGRLDA